MTKNITKRNYIFDEKTKRLDIYDLIDSKDVAEHCRAIGYEFNIIEAADIIINCKKLSLVDKIECFNILIGHYDDMEIAGREDYDSVKILLKWYIYELKGEIEIFEEEEDGCEYRIWRCKKNYYLYKNRFNSLNEAKEFSKKKLIKHRDKNDIYLLIGKVNRYMDFADTFCDAYLDKDGEYTWINYEDHCYEKEILLRNLSGAHIIPTPFKIGDILNVPKGIFHGNIVVFDRICNDGDKTWRALGYMLDRNGEICLMNVYHYYVLEYYRAPLEGKYRLLKPVSSLLKGEITKDLFIDEIEAIRTEEKLSKKRKVKDDRYDDGDIYIDEIAQLARARKDEL